MSEETPPLLAILIATVMKKEKETPPPRLDSLEPDHAELGVRTEIRVSGANFIRTLTSFYLSEKLCDSEILSESEARVMGVCDLAGWCYIVARSGYHWSDSVLPFLVGDLPSARWHPQEVECNP